MIDIIEVKPGIWVLEEDGQNVLLKDCQQFEIGKQERKTLFQSLEFLAKALQEGRSYAPLIEQCLLKKLQRQKEALELNLWEVRAEGRGERIIFAMREPNLIIVAAVHKSKGGMSQAVNRGVKRWKRFLKGKEK